MSALNLAVLVVVAAFGLSVTLTAMAPWFVPDAIDGRSKTTILQQQSVIEVTALPKGTSVSQNAELDQIQFCCRSYVQTLLENIDRAWSGKGNQGVTRIQFTIERDGRITRAAWIQRSGSVSQDVGAMRAVQTIRMPPLPQEFTERVLVIRMTFKYGGQ